MGSGTRAHLVDLIPNLLHDNNLVWPATETSKIPEFKRHGYLWGHHHPYRSGRYLGSVAQPRSLNSNHTGFFRISCLENNEPFIHWCGLLDPVVFSLYC